MGKTVVCPCHDVTVADLVRMFAEGYRDPETLKRITGAFMGPCQGKFCLSAVQALTAELTGVEPSRRPTSRPPIVPVPMGLFAAAAGQDGDHEEA